jgi:hypothetical protein
LDVEVVDGKTGFDGGELSEHGNEWSGGSLEEWNLRGVSKNVFVAGTGGKIVAAGVGSIPYIQRGKTLLRIRDVWQN